MTKISGLSSNAGKAIMGAGMGGTMNNMMGTSMGLGVNPATFSQSMMPMMRATAWGAMVGGVVKGAAQMGAGVAAGAYTAMPDLGTTVARASGYYGAGLMGGMNRTSLAKVSM